MTALVFILTLLVGFFIGVSTAVGAALYIIEKTDAKKKRFEAQVETEMENINERVRVGENPFEWPSQTPE